MGYFAENNIPQWLKENGHFCLWKYENRNGRQTKVPYNAKGFRAKPSEVDSFSNFATAVSALKSRADYAGIGIGIFDDLVGIDIDHCVDENGAISDFALDVINMVGSYTETSPSGRGVHILCRAPELVYDKDQYFINNREIGLEIYVGGSTYHYLTLTGDVLNNKDICICSNEVQQIANEYMRKSGQNKQSDEVSDSAYDYPMDDETVLQRIFTCKNGFRNEMLFKGEWEALGRYQSQSEADMAFCNELAFWTRKNEDQMQRLFNRSGLFRDDTEKKRSGKQYSTLTIEKAIRDCTTIWNPMYRMPGAANDRIEKAIKFLEEKDALNNQRYSQDDIGAGYLLADYLKPFARPLSGSGQWMFYDGAVWDSKQAVEKVEEAAKDLSRALLSYAYKNHIGNQNNFENWANEWKKSGRRKIYIAEASSVYPVKRSDFDKNKFLFNVKNGTIDLSDPDNILLLPHNPDDLLTQLAPVNYAPGVKCERFERFIYEIMDSVSSTPEERDRDTGDKARFFQRFSGYCLCGETKEESFLIMYGPTTRNGKSVSVRTIQTIMGSYAKSTNVETITLAKLKDGSGPTENIARLAGARLVSAGEVPQGGILDASKIKSFTGGDIITARYLKENSFDFVPQFKLILHTNHMPHCNDISVFSSGRIMVLKFERHFSEAEQDKNLKQLFELPENQSGILNWLIAGYIDYRKIGGLNPPEAVLTATKEYQYNNDKIARFLDDVMEPASGAIMLGSDVLTAYTKWAIDNNEIELNLKTLISALEEHMVRTDRKRPPRGLFKSSEKQRLVYGYRLKLSTEENMDSASPHNAA